MLGVDPRVDLCGRERRMSEEFLDGSQVAAASEQMRRERVAQSVRSGSVGQAERATQPRHRQLYNTRREGLAARSDKKWSVWRIFVRTKREVFGDRLRNLWKHGHHARLVALAGYGEAVGLSGKVLALQAKGLRLRNLSKHGHHARLVALAGYGEAVGLSGKVLALQAKGLRNPQAASVKQGKHGRVARDDPGLAFLALAQIRIGDLLGGGYGQRLWQSSRQFRCAHRGECSDFPLSVSFKEARERAAARKRPHQRAIAGAFAPPRGHEGANVSRGQPDELFQRRRRTQMLGQNVQE